MKDEEGSLRQLLHGHSYGGIRPQEEDRTGRIKSHRSDILPRELRNLSTHHLDVQQRHTVRPCIVVVILRTPRYPHTTTQTLRTYTAPVNSFLESVEEEDILFIRWYDSHP
jgi:hypothetical protein